MSIKIEDINNVNFSSVVIKGKRLAPTAPGDILLHDFMKPLEMSANALANALNVPTNRITSIINKRRVITADTAIRLSLYFGNSAQFWLNLQTNYDLEVAQQALGNKLKREIKPWAA